MKVVQTFWTGNQSADTTKPLLEFKCGWRSSEYHWISWAFSCFKLLELYGQVELVTDKRGKEILIDILKLPYTSVSTVLEDELGEIHPRLFALAKIKTYSLQTEPFIHVDGDLFLFQPLHPAILQAPLISSNPEADLYFNSDVLKEVNDQGFWLPDHLQGVHQHPQIFSSNAGIIGGNDLSFIKDYCDFAFEFAERNRDKLDLVDTGNLNFLIEQLSFFYLAQQRQIPTAYVSPEPVSDPLYHDFINLADIPNVVMAHAAGGCKRSDFMLSHILRRFRMYYPEQYYQILRLCRDQGVSMSASFYTANKVSWLPNEREVAIERDEDHAQLNGLDFSQRYGRTIKAINHVNPEASFKNHEELKVYLANEPISPQCRDIYQIDHAIDEALNQIDDQEHWEERYRLGVTHYAQTANAFEVGRGEIDGKQLLALSAGINFLRTGWHWWKEGDPELDSSLKENFEIEPEGFRLLVIPDIIDLKVNAHYPDQLDSVILDLLESPRTVDWLLQEVSEAFEDDIDPNTDVAYRKLMFETLKRMLFSRSLVFV